MIKALDTFLASMRTAGKTMDDHGKSRTLQSFPPAPSPSLYCSETKAGANLYWFAGYSWQQNAGEVTAVMV